MGDGPLRVALVTDWYPPSVGGVEAQVFGLAQALQARGHEVRVFTTSLGTDDPEPVPTDRFPFRYVPGTRIALPTPGHYRALRARLAAGRFDVMHAHGMFSTLAMGGVMAARSLGIPSVTTHHSLIRLAHLPFARFVYLVAWHRADIVTAVSAAAARDARRASGRCEVLTLPNGIDIGPLCVAPTMDATGAAPAATTEGPIRVTSVMRLKFKKKPYHLMMDFKRVLHRVSDASRIRFTVVGDGPERARVERLATVLGIASHVEFAGACTRIEVARILAGSSLFVSPVRAEAFGLALLEARVAGLPIVAINGGGVAEIVEHDRHGLLAATRREFVDAIVRVIDDEALRRRLAAGSRDGLARFAWDAVAEQHVDVYRLAIARGGRAPERSAA